MNSASSLHTLDSFKLPEGNYLLLQPHFQIQRNLRHDRSNVVHGIMNTANEVEGSSQEKTSSKSNLISFEKLDEHKNYDGKIEKDLPFNLCQYKAAHNSFDKGKLRDQLTFFKESPGKGSCLCVELDLVQG